MPFDLCGRGKQRRKLTAKPPRGELGKRWWHWKAVLSSAYKKDKNKEEGGRAEKRG